MQCNFFLCVMFKSDLKWPMDIFGHMDIGLPVLPAKLILDMYYGRTLTLTLFVAAIHTAQD